MEICLQSLNSPHILEKWFGLHVFAFYERASPLGGVHKLRLQDLVFFTTYPPPFTLSTV